MSHKSKVIESTKKSSAYSKSLVVAIAAFALTATGAQAFTRDALLQAGLTENQRAAFEVARELRLEGDVVGARDVLVDAGIDEVVIERVRTAMSDYQAKPAVNDTWQNAHESLTSAQEAALAAARAANDHETMTAILEEAGVTVPKSEHHSIQTLRDGRQLGY